MHEKLDYFDPLFVAAFIMAAMSDFAFLFILGLTIPVIGLVIAAFILGTHYLVGIFIFAAIFFKLKHFVPKLILGAGVLLPTPTLVIGIAIAIVAQNRLVELVITQAALALATGGAGNVAAGVAKGAEIAGGAGAAAKGVEMAGGAARGLEAAGEAAEGGAAIAEGSETISAGRAATRKGLRGRVERGLKTRVEDLEKELAEEESVGEEDFGIVEPTDKMKELFEPEFQGQKEELEAEAPSTISRWVIDPETGKEIYRPQDQNSNQPQKVIKLPERQEDGGVDINEDTNEVNLKKEV